MIEQTPSTIKSNPISSQVFRDSGFSNLFNVPFISLQIEKDLIDLLISSVMCHYLVSTDEKVVLQQIFRNVNGRCFSSLLWQIISQSKA